MSLPIIGITWSDAQFGSVADWLAAVGTIGAVIVALWLIRRDNNAARERETKRVADERRRDLDEVRRLIYMLVAHQKQGEAHSNPEIAGTIFNALIHHSDVLPRETRKGLSAWMIRGAPLDAEGQKVLSEAAKAISRDLDDKGGGGKSTSS